MKIPFFFGILVVSFETKTPMPWVVRREVKLAMFTDGKADLDKRLWGVKKHREMTGSSLRDAVEYTDKFFQKEDRIVGNTHE